MGTHRYEISLLVFNSLVRVKKVKKCHISKQPCIILFISIFVCYETHEVGKLICCPLLNCVNKHILGHFTALSEQIRLSLHA